MVSICRLTMLAHRRLIDCWRSAIWRMQAGWVEQPRIDTVLQECRIVERTNRRPRSTSSRHYSNCCTCKSAIWRMQTRSGLTVHGSTANTVLPAASASWSIACPVDDSAPGRTGSHTLCALRHKVRLATCCCARDEARRVSVSDFTESSRAAAALEWAR